MEESLLERSVAGYRDEYGQCMDTWRDIEAKAHGMISVVGIFLAAAFAFVSQLAEAAHTIVTISLLIFALLFLVSSVVSALTALWVRSSMAPPLGDVLNVMIEDMVALKPAERTERLENFVRDLIALWKNCCDNTHRLNEKKVRWVICAQCMLMIAIGLTSMLSVIVILGG